MQFGQDVLTFSFQFDGLRSQKFLVPLPVWKSTYDMIGSTRVRIPALLLKVACTSSGKTRNCSSTCMTEWHLSAKYHGVLSGLTIWKNKSGEKTATCHIHLSQFPCWIQHGKCWTRHHSSGMPYREKWNVISCRYITCNTWWCYEKLVSNLERIVGLGINEDLGIRGVDLYVFPCNLPVQHTFI